MEYRDGIESTSIDLTGVEVTDPPHLAEVFTPEATAFVADLVRTFRDQRIASTSAPAPTSSPRPPRSAPAPGPSPRCPRICSTVGSRSQAPPPAR